MSTESGSFDPDPYIGLIVYNILNAVCFGSRLVDFSTVGVYFLLFPKYKKEYNDYDYLSCVFYDWAYIFNIGDPISNTDYVFLYQSITSTDRITFR